MPESEGELTPSRVAAAVLAVTAVLVALASLASARAAIVALAVFALAGAVARVVSPLRRTFAVRRQWVDVTVLAVLGTALAYLGLTTPLG